VRTLPLAELNARVHKLVYFGTSTIFTSVQIGALRTLKDSASHYNVRPHTAARTRALLEHLLWELFNHLLYRPDLAPRDYHLHSALATMRS
jgi:hypothetical protein